MPCRRRINTDGFFFPTCHHQGTWRGFAKKSFNETPYRLLLQTKSIYCEICGICVHCRHSKSTGYLVSSDGVEVRHGVRTNLSFTHEVQHSSGLKMHETFHNTNAVNHTKFPATRQRKNDVINSTHCLLPMLGYPNGSDDGTEAYHIGI